MQKLPFCKKRLNLSHLYTMWWIQNSKMVEKMSYGIEFYGFQFWAHSLQIILIKHLNFLKYSFLIYRMENNNTHEGFFFFWERIKDIPNKMCLLKFGSHYYFDRRA